MVDALLLSASFLCAFCGMGWLALAMKPHWIQVRGPAPLSEANARKLRVVSVLGLLLSLAACLAADHVSMASLVWIMTLGASALAVAMTLAYAPRLLTPLLLPLRLPVRGRD